MAGFMGYMTLPFGEALIWHMETHGKTIAEVAAGAQVSADILKKLRTRPKSSTKADTAVRIAGYFGKTVEQFLNCVAVSQRDQIAAALELLDDHEARMLLAQIRGMIAERERSGPH